MAVKAYLVHAEDVAIRIVRGVGSADTQGSTGPVQGKVRARVHFCSGQRRYRGDHGGELGWPARHLPSRWSGVEILQLGSLWG